MTGFFPVMMFGLPGACLAMYHCAKTTRKKVTAGLMFSAAVSAFFVGITEPIEFAFMFLAPVLYAVHAGLTAISMTICAILPVRSGFNFSAGFVDWFLSFKAPMALNPWIIIPIGAAYFGIYYAIFRTLIVKLNLKTPGREDDEVVEIAPTTAGASAFAQQAAIILEGIGGSANIANFEHCATRLRFEVKDVAQVNDAKIKSAGVAGIVRPGKNSVQVIIGPKVQFVHDEIKALIG
jgi:PTS system N-acetylglucosamine-specific IIC component